MGKDLFIFEIQSDKQKNMTIRQTEKHDNQTNRKTFIAHQTNIYTDSKTDREEARNINLKIKKNNEIQ